MASTATFKKQTLSFTTAITQNFNSFAVESQMHVFFMIKATGTTASGTVKVQASANGGADWFDVPSATVAVTTPATPLVSAFNIPQYGAPLLRVVAISAGTNPLTVDVWGYAKGG